MSKPAITVENLSKWYRLDPCIRRGSSAVTSVLDTLALRCARNRSQDEGDGGFWALKDVSFEVRPGEVVGIIGRNGAGKSTLLKILSRITAPTAGRARIHGRMASLLEVGTGFHRELTGRENIFLNGAIHGMKKAEISRKFDEIVSFAEVEKFIDTPVKHYSSGMYVRLAFAVAAHLEPEILLVDEVLTVGDAAFQKKCVGKMSDAASHGRTILFVSHSMPAVFSLCPRAILIERGRIVDDGPASDVVRSYLRSTTAAPGTDTTETLSRSGTGDVRFRTIRFLDQNNQPTTEFCCGDPLQVMFDFDLHGRTSCSDIQVGFTFRDHEDRPLFICRTDFQPQIIDRLNQDRQLLCTIPRLPLYPGEYYVTAAITEHGVVTDLLERMAQIQVSPGNFYGSGRLSTGTRAQVLVPHEWKELT